MKLLEQVYQQEHHRTKTLPLKELQDPQVILRCAGYSLFPCLRIPYINRQGERAASTDLIALSEGWVTTVRAAAESHKASRGTAPWAVWPGDNEITEFCRPSVCKPGKLNRTGKKPAAVALQQQDKEERLSARANVQQSGRTPAREPGERKLSDEEPGKAPRLNSTVGRTKMKMENAKISGISFLQRNNLY